MELPPYHLPRARHIFRHTWERLSIFIVRAGKFIVPMVLVLGFLNTVGTDGSIGKEESKDSLLSVVGKAVTPVFEPIGVEKENWPASVAVFTGLFAKESVIGTMKGLYGQTDAAHGSSASHDEKEEYSLVRGIKAAFASVPKNLSGVLKGFIDPLASSDVREEVGREDTRTIDALKRHFPKGVHQVYSFLLFILLYVPCIAATGVVFREIGKIYGIIFVCYLTVLGWSVAALYHALMVSHSSLWFLVGSGTLVLMFTGFWAFGRKHRIDMI